MNYNSAVDAYIANSEDFAKPILEHWRQLVHKSCPDVEETIKWSLPHFDYKGDNMCVAASYKNHCSLHVPEGRTDDRPAPEGKQGFEANPKIFGKDQ